MQRRSSRARRRSRKTAAGSFEDLPERLLVARFEASDESRFVVDVPDVQQERTAVERELRPHGARHDRGDDRERAETEWLSQIERYDHEARAWLSPAPSHHAPR